MFSDWCKLSIHAEKCLKINKSLKLLLLSLLLLLLVVVVVFLTSLLCLRGSRSSRRVNLNLKEMDFDIERGLLGR